MRKSPYIPLHRTFASFAASAGSDDDVYDSAEWYRQLVAPDLQSTWPDLLARRLVVVVGEAGLGKTSEFKQQADELLRRGKAAFFFPLNELTSREALDLHCQRYAERLRRWHTSDEPGYFFLDSVDEARLKSTAAFSNALRLVAGYLLQPHLSRASVFISSRISDWGIAAVRDAVDELLRAPLQEASAEAAPLADAGPTVRAARDSKRVEISVDVFELKPLSEGDAKRLAALHGVGSVEAFWADVVDGGYEFMATRPLDLEWMARRWVRAGQLGGYTEVIENAVTERLEERNASYREAGVVLSSQQLRSGVETLAAACVFANRAHIALPEAIGSDSTVNPSEALAEWKPHEIERLLGTAVFDEASYARVKFHHRVVREYLAACWVKARLTEGLPLSTGLSFFVQTAFEQEVLLDRRRAILSWLVSMHAGVRAHVIRVYPELVMFEGDPARWSADEVADALEAFLQRVQSGYRPNWYNDSSELRRVAVLLPEEILSAQLTRYGRSSAVLHHLLRLIVHARAGACAPVVRSLYRDPNTRQDDVPALIETLGVVGNVEDREQLATDLLSEKLTGNQQIIAALEACGLARFSIEQLVAILGRVESNTDEASSTAFHVNRELLETADSSGVLKLLSVLVSLLPAQSIDDDELDAEALPARWLLHAGVDWLKRAIELLPKNSTSVPDVIVRVALLMPKLRDTTTLDDDDLGKLQALISERPILRRMLAAAIGIPKTDHIFSEFIQFPSVVSYGPQDLPGLLIEANRQDLVPAERALWFRIALEMAIYRAKGATRRAALSELANFPDANKRSVAIAAERTAYVRRLCAQRQSRRNRYERKRQSRRQLEQNRIDLLSRVEGIRDGSDHSALRFLLRSAGERGDATRYRNPRLEDIRATFGSEIAGAFNEGLKRLWRTIDIEPPSAYPDHETPWSGVLALAGINRDFADGLTLAAMTPEETDRALQLAVWERERHGPWLAAAVEANSGRALDLVKPWLDEELRDPKAARQRVTDYVLNAPAPLQERGAMHILDLIDAGVIGNEHLMLRMLAAMARQPPAIQERAAEHAWRELDARYVGKTFMFPYHWFGALAGVSLSAAFEWAVARLPAEEHRPGFVAAVASSINDARWRDCYAGTAEEIDTLVRLFNWLESYAMTDPEAHRDDSSIRRLSSAIPEQLSSTSGPIAHHALQQLATMHASTSRGAWLRDRVRAHAAVEAEARSTFRPAELRSLESRYCREPETTTTLFEQVLARLEEIKQVIETGPFSERGLFPPRIAEKQLQLWLASRLSDTPQRRFNPRFNIHREPVVDLDNRTDIEVSARAGKVCIEIKPLDESRSYTATSLVDTLRTQLVGQYLRGRNSRHGILLLMRLDEKQWQIPGKSRLRPYSDLLAFLEAECERIVSENRDIEALRIVSVDCTVPARSP